MLFCEGMHAHILVRKVVIIIQNQKRETDLSHEHRSGWDLHVVPELEVLQKCQGLCHADVSIYLEAHVRDRPAWIQVPHEILCDDV